MYGYRRNDLGLLRLFLPPQLHRVFKAIHKMEQSLRAHIEKNANEEFRGIYLENGLSPTRKSVLAPGSMGVYSGGSNYNPAQLIRDETIEPLTQKIDKMLSDVADGKYSEMSIDKMHMLLTLIRPDESCSEDVWNGVAISESLLQYAKLKKQKTGYVYVDRDRDLEATRRETAGVLSGDEFRRVPLDKVTLYMLRTRARGGKRAAWWPHVRFPEGPYAFAFAI
jgi:hypothetical protein